MKAFSTFVIPFYFVYPSNIVPILQCLWKILLDMIFKNKSDTNTCPWPVLWFVDENRHVTNFCGKTIWQDRHIFLREIKLNVFWCGRSYSIQNMCKLARVVSTQCLWWRSEYAQVSTWSYQWIVQMIYLSSVEKGQKLEISPSLLTKST